MGYPTPDTIPLKENATFRGICVMVPNEPEYIRALMGSLSGLATWGVWERDDNQSGSKSAELWKLANAITFANIINECGGYTVFDCEEMKDCLIEVAKAIDLNVTVNNYISSGGSSNTLYCVDDDGNITINPPPRGDYPTEPTIPPPVDDITPIDDGREPDTGEPPEGWDTWESYDYDACQAANALVEYGYQWSRRCSDFLTEDLYTIAAVLVVIVNILTVGWGVLFEAALMVKISELVAKLQLWGQPVGYAFELLADYIEENRQDMVCELYQSRTGASNWSNMIIARLFGASADTFEDITARNTWQELLGYIFPQNLAANTIYRVFTWQGETTNFVDCSQCTENAGVWEFVLNGDNVQLSDGWNTPEHLSYTASGERNSSFSSGYIQAKLDFVPDLDYPTQLKITVLRDDRTSGALTQKATLTKGVGIFVTEAELSLGDNYIDVDVSGVNQLSIKTIIDRAVSGVQSIDFECTLQYWQEDP